MELKTIYETLIDILKEEGFILQGYESVTTNSFYLKLDYGVMKTIRISDHPAKSHLKYRYNIGPHHHKKEYVRQTQRFFYPEDAINDLVAQIKSDRRDRMDRYGMKYFDYMQKNLNSKQHTQGFWKDAKIIS